VNYFEEVQKEVIDNLSKTLLQETTDDDSDSSILRPMLNMKKNVIEEQNLTPIFDKDVTKELILNVSEVINSNETTGVQDGKELQDGIYCEIHEKKEEKVNVSDGETLEVQENGIYEGAEIATEQKTNTQGNGKP
jgi:hypothetical protein